jgi:CubicO group peptidase (beta-lactamase class C family)
MYSGGGFTVAQLLATDVSSEPFPALMKRLVLDPADMPNSTFENPLPAAFATTAATGHEHVHTPVTGRYHSYPEMAAAGLWTTAPDLARWAIALSRAYNGEDGGVLSPAFARQMLSKQAAIPPAFGGGSVGLGVEISGEGDSLSFSHAGKDEGFLANVRMWPRLGRGYVVLTNGVSGALLGEIDRAFAESYGLTGPPRVERQAVSVTSAALEGLAGQYVYKQSRPPSSPPRGLISIVKSDEITLDISARDTVLWLNNAFNGRSYRLWPLGDDAFFDVNSGTAVVFEREGRSLTTRGRSLRLGSDAKAPVAKRK